MGRETGTDCDAEARVDQGARVRISPRKDERRNATRTA